MILRWEKGRSGIDELIARGRLERVSADRSLADQYMARSRDHLASSKLLTDADPAGSFQLAYDASRKALVAVLINQGLRPTSKGGHLVIEEALRAQLTPPKNEVVDGFGWMRVLRNTTEYPSYEQPSASAQDAVEAQIVTLEVIDKAEQLLGAMPVY